MEWAAYADGIENNAPPIMIHANKKTAGKHFIIAVGFVRERIECIASIYMFLL